MKAEIEAVRCLLGDAQMAIYWNIFAALEAAKAEGFNEAYSAGHSAGCREGYELGIQDAYMQVPEADEQPSDHGLEVFLGGQDHVEVFR